MDRHGGNKQWGIGVVLALLVIVSVGFFLRSYHFSEWLHFELDQSRDAKVIDDVVQGSLLDLPLLGPKAGGTFLRLGPAFYYFQYVSGLVFGATPSGYAAWVMVLSVATIGIFFLFVRRFFSDRIVLLLTALLSVSTFFVLYGRFSWNPNPLPFFVLSGMYALLRSVDTHEARRGQWFIATAFLFGIASQLHFLAFLALPVISIAFLLLKRPRYSWRAWMGACIAIGLLYVPVVLNEIQSGGQNSAEFIKAVTEKSTKEQHGFLEKLLRDGSEHGLAALVIVTGFEGGTFPTMQVIDGRLSYICINHCDEGKWYGATATLMWLVSIVALAFLWWREHERVKSDFLLLSGLWFVVTFLLFLPLSYGIAPRFFLLSGPLFFVFLGALFTCVERGLHRRSIGKILVLFITALLILSNGFFITNRLNELLQSGKRAVESAPDRILKERIRVTLEQQIAIVDFLADRSRKTHVPVYMLSEPQYQRALKYLLTQRGIETPSFSGGTVYRQGVYFLVLRAQSNHEDALKKYQNDFVVGQKTSFGTLIVFELLPKPEAIVAERPNPSLKTGVSSTAPPRYTWREWLNQSRPVMLDTETTTANGQEESVDDGL